MIERNYLQGMLQVQNNDEVYNVKLPRGLRKTLNMRRCETLSFDDLTKRIPPNGSSPVIMRPYQAFSIVLYYCHQDLLTGRLKEILPQCPSRITDHCDHLIGISSPDYLKILRETTKRHNISSIIDSVLMVEKLYRDKTCYHKLALECLREIGDRNFGNVYNYVMKSCHIPSIRYILKKTNVKKKDTIFWIIDGYGTTEFPERRKLKAIRYLHEKKGFPLKCYVEYPYSQARSHTPKQSAEENNYREILHYLHIMGKGGVSIKKAR